MKTPKTRNEDIVVQEMDKEILIYDLKTNKAFCLNETSAKIYHLCNWKNSVADIAQILSKETKQSISEDIIWLALDGFKKDNLLEESEQFEIDFNGLSRRQVIKKIGFASMIALPIVSSIIAPNALMAQSGTNLAINAACSSNAQCASGNCLGNTKCCASGSTGGTTPVTFLGNVFGPAGSCAAFPQANQDTLCSNSFSPAQCCNGIVVSTPCTDLGGFPRLSCRCSPTP